MLLVHQKSLSIVKGWKQMIFEFLKMLEVDQVL
jgi:hypothetical protein